MRGDIQHLLPTRPTDSGDGGSDSEFYRLLSQLPAAAYTCDAQGLITYFNSHAAALWGREPKLNDPADRFCGSFRLFSADGTPISHDQCWMALALREGKEYNNQEILIERPNGTRLTALAHANPFLDDFGRIRGAVNVLVDISDRKQAELAQTRLAAIVESSDDAIVSKSLDGTILSWNGGAERLFDYTAAEAIGQSITIIIPPERRAEEGIILARISRGERIAHYQTVRVSKQGRRIDISLTISPIRDASGRVVGASKVARDITAQKRAEEVLRQSDRRKSEFLAVLAHEMRNPLAPLCNGMNVIRHAGHDPAKVDRAHAMMERQLGHLVRLVDDLLDLSRITQGKIELRRDRLDLAVAVEDAVETSRPFIEAARHQLTIELPPAPMWVSGDRTRLAQVFSNLLNNSARYTEPGGRIEITVAQHESHAVVKVKDTGVGIPADSLPWIFDMFAQANRSLERSRGGLGIGLSLVKALVEMHGGSVEVRSDGVGRGSEFAVRLPALLSNDEQPGQSKKPVDQADSTPRYRVLVVDDNEDGAASLADLLELRGHKTWTAHDGFQAIAMAEAFHPDVVLLDIGLPKLNGYEVCRHLRAQPWGKQMVLIAQTGWGQDEDRVQSKEAGFDFHLVKPVDQVVLEKFLAGLRRTHI